MELELFDEEGYLIDSNKWNKTLSEEFAHQENIHPTKDHRDAILFMRQY
jgi:sulfur relay (sulfurtransferase) DsrC/TusE family protein